MSSSDHSLIFAGLHQRSHLRRLGKDFINERFTFPEFIQFHHFKRQNSSHFADFFIFLSDKNMEDLNIEKHPYASIDIFGGLCIPSHRISTCLPPLDQYENQDSNRDSACKSSSIFVCKKSSQSLFKTEALHFLSKGKCTAMAQKMNIRNLPDWPRMMSAETAAAYVGMSTVTFRKLVNEGTFPKPVSLGPRLVVWDKAAIDKVIDFKSGFVANENYLGIKVL